MKSCSGLIYRVAELFERGSYADVLWVAGLIEEMYTWCSDDTARPHAQLLRFMAHLVLFFRALGVTEQVRSVYITTHENHHRVVCYTKAEATFALFVLSLTFT